MKMPSTKAQILHVLDTTSDDFTSLSYVTNEVACTYRSVPRVMKILVKSGVVESFAVTKYLTHYRLTNKPDLLLDHVRALRNG